MLLLYNILLRRSRKQTLLHLIHALHTSFGHSWHQILAVIRKCDTKLEKVINLYKQPYELCKPWTETATTGVQKKMFLKFSQNLQENTCPGDSLLIKS